MTKSKAAHIANLIHTTFIGEEIRLDDYLSQLESTLRNSSSFSFSTDELYDTLDSDSSAYKLVKFELRQLIEEERKRNTDRVYLKQDIFDYVGNTAFGQKINYNIHGQLNKAIKGSSTCNPHLKGQKYENLCKLFLQDVGVDTIKTAKSGDGGVDLLGEFMFKCDNPLFKHAFPVKAYVLAQVKFYEAAVDIPIIRHLVGDSLFYQFNSIESFNLMSAPIVLSCFSHNGFTKTALAFAEKNKVILFDTDRMLNIMCNSTDIESLSSVQYIRTDIASLA